jgi:uncharacterized membrane protein
VLALLSAVFASLALVTMRKLTSTEPAGRIVFYFALGSTVGAAVPLAWSWQTPTAAQWVPLFLTGAAASLAQFLLSRGYARCPAAVAAVFQYLTVPTAALLGWLLWEERLGAVAIAGSGLICVAGILASWPGRRPAPASARRDLTDAPPAAWSRGRDSDRLCAMKPVVLVQRPRRNRRTEAIRRLVRETELTPAHLILPLFVCEGRRRRVAIASMPGCFRLSRDLIVREAREARKLGITAVALFPALPDRLKDKTASESLNRGGPAAADGARAEGRGAGAGGHHRRGPGSVFQRRPRRLRERASDEIDNDRTLEILSAMAVLQAEAGADLVAPSDMMDGRVGAIRKALDAAGHTGPASWPTPRSTARPSTARSARRSIRSAAPRRQEDLPDGVPPTRARRCAR